MESMDLNVIAIALFHREISTFCYLYIRKKKKTIPPFLHQVFPSVACGYLWPRPLLPPQGLLSAPR